MATKENDPDTIHPILTNILQAGQVAITATVELGGVKTVTIVISTFKYMYNESFEFSSRRATWLIYIQLSEGINHQFKMV